MTGSAGVARYDIQAKHSRSFSLRTSHMHFRLHRGIDLSCNKLAAVQAT